MLPYFSRFRGITSSLIFVLFTLVTVASTGKINRKSIVQRYNVLLNASHPYSPVQLGNGNFAFNTDIAGLQTFVPHNTLSSWGWHNSSLPTTPNQTQISDFTGLEWWTHGRLVKYAQPNPEEQDISQWLIANPHRINLGRIGLWFGAGKNVSEVELKGRNQVLDLWSGISISTFTYNNKKVSVKTVVDPETDTVAVEIESDLLKKGNLGVFFDFPYASGKNKFDAPFVGVWNATANHTTTVLRKDEGAVIKHALDATTYFVHIDWDDNDATIRRETEGAHRYILRPGRGDGTLSFTSTFSPSAVHPKTSFDKVRSTASSWWSNYWNSGAFISLPTAANSSAHELQRRIILSQYLLAINGAGRDPPQESGLANNGWYGKFHMEMVFWHLAHWQFWNKWSLYDRSIDVYERFLPSSFERAKKQGYKGARLGKMSDPSGRSAPGQINSLLIWQQVHPMYFAEMEYRKFPTTKTLRKWDAVLTAAADWMADYAFWNETTKRFDLGPPMYPVSENTNPNQTINPTFELAYWRFGLDIASQWQKRQRKGVPETWTQVYDKLAPFPVENGLYVTYEGIDDMWTTPEYTEDHQGLLGIYGWLPPDPERFSLPTFTATLEKVYETWNFTFSYGWDFPLLAMAAARTGDAEKALEWLLHESFQFDEVGMPVGGARVPTPYFPGSAGLLLAVGMMSGGWDGLDGPVFPKEWNVEVEGFERGM
ncbi:hypothetical protein GQ43DRAFT_443185 [Delitschia confertaspora ATCC 74209]|uniref:Six-hairpin glycosidase-like protein n=1 Tax=Delitschia confertaspora ATCC 74209 TaxID=1513339 RepID=A0A9P4JIF8_9PLEO|nr:hypothetical protein GQ43DRAFT_443185 [Delitschia confertaspora ATCC 74209]